MQITADLVVLRGGLIYTCKTKATGQPLKLYLAFLHPNDMNIYTYTAEVARVNAFIPNNQ